MKECELCNYPARMYCDSDQASLCWDCDAKVHCANFLVARHSRSLLCHICQSPTPWKASGSKLGPTVSVCQRCANNCNGSDERSEIDEEREGANEDDDEFAGELDDDDDDDDSEDEDDDDDYSDDDDDESGENQVVPWSSTPPPPVASSSSSDDESSSNGRKRGIAESTMPFSLKRTRENADLGCHDDLGCSSSQPNNDTAFAATAARRGSKDEEATSYGSFRPSKCLKRTLANSSVPPAAAVLSSLQRFTSGEDSTATILEIRKLSKDPGAVDLDHHNRRI
ncbi:zinc finger protein CONSTANS-LIKE 10-like [Macadamia integrifolia]|uniref:zinc finger protein CONSTANS-LIKE 10-like n=1 Tax=Macadamia integrifolia TaxID=60698 RepID=UPI001C532B87|nr:zinc finger protein CONSTANS-LIKE 10-like [Macadamia integrifolia]